MNKDFHQVKAFVPPTQQLFAFDSWAIKLVPELNVEKRQREALLPLGNTTITLRILFLFDGTENTQMDLDAFEAMGFPRRVSSLC